MKALTGLPEFYILPFKTPSARTMPKPVENSPRHGDFGTVLF